MQAQNETAHEWVQYWPVVGGFWIGVNALLSLFFLIVTILSMIFMFKLCYQKGLLNIRTHIVMFGFFTVLSGFVANVVSASCYGLNECRKTVFTFELTGIVMYFNTVLRMVLFWAFIYHKTFGSTNPKVASYIFATVQSVLFPMLALVSIGIALIGILLLSDVFYRMTIDGLILASSLSIVFVIYGLLLLVKLTHRTSERTGSAIKQLGVITGLSTTTFLFSIVNFVVLIMRGLDVGLGVSIVAPLGHVAFTFLLVVVPIAALVVYFGMNIGAVSHKEEKPYAPLSQGPDSAIIDDDTAQQQQAAAQKDQFALDAEEFEFEENYNQKPLME